MLPFLKKDRGNAGIATEYRKPDQPEEAKDDDGLESCAADLMRSLNENNTKGIAAALRAAFEILDSQPHEEFDHDSDDSYTS